MCQIIGISNISGLTRNQITRLCLAGRNLMSSQPDGFGFAYSTTNRSTKEHAYYCEKYVNPKHFNGIGTVGNSKAIMNRFSAAIEMPMMSSGHADSPTGPLIMHGRIGTSGTGILNTHPFRKKGWALVHNGVVDLEKWAFDNDKYATLLDDRYSNCDSEWLLNTYVHGKGHHDWYTYLSGYAATMAISPTNDFIVAKDSKASLYMAGIPKLNNSVIFATRPDFCTAMAKVLSYASTPPYKMLGGRAIQIQTSTGQVNIDKFKEMDSGYTSNQLVSRSLGNDYKGTNIHATYTQHKGINEVHTTETKHSAIGGGAMKKTSKGTWKSTTPSGYGY